MLVVKHLKNYKFFLSGSCSIKNVYSQKLKQVQIARNLRLNDNKKNVKKQFF